MTSPPSGATHEAPAGAVGEDGIEHDAPPCLVALDAFSGPLDLLLFLVRRAEVDVVDIPISDIADQYVATVAAWADLDLDLAGDFILMAATLLEIKSRLIAPPSDEPLEEAGDEEVLDLRSGLVAKLLAYRRCKEAALALAAREDERNHRSTRQLHEAIPDDPDELGIDLENADPYALAATWEGVLARIQGLGPRTVMADPLPLETAMAILVQTLETLGQEKLSHLFATQSSRLGRVTLLMAVLECVRQRLMLAAQYGQYEEIELRYRPPTEREIATQLPPETLESGKRRRRPPLVTIQSPAESAEEQEGGAEDVVETDEQRFMRELEETCALESVLEQCSDLDQNFARFWALKRGLPWPPPLSAALPTEPLRAPEPVAPAVAPPAAARPARRSAAPPPVADTVAVVEAAPADAAPPATETAVAVVEPAGAREPAASDDQTPLALASGEDAAPAVAAQEPTDPAVSTAGPAMPSEPVVSAEQPPLTVASGDGPTPVVPAPEPTEPVLSVTEPAPGMEPGAQEPSALPAEPARQHAPAAASASASASASENAVAAPGADAAHAQPQVVAPVQATETPADLALPALAPPGATLTQDQDPPEDDLANAPVPEPLPAQELPSPGNVLSAPVVESASPETEQDAAPTPEAQPRQDAHASDALLVQSAAALAPEPITQPLPPAALAAPEVVARSSSLPAMISVAITPSPAAEHPPAAPAHADDAPQAPTVVVAAQQPIDRIPGAAATSAGVADATHSADAAAGLVIEWPEATAALDTPLSAVRIPSERLRVIDPLGPAGAASRRADVAVDAPLAKGEAEWVEIEAKVDAVAVAETAVVPPASVAVHLPELVPPASAAVLSTAPPPRDAALAISSPAVSDTTLSPTQQRTRATTLHPFPAPPAVKRQGRQLALSATMLLIAATWYLSTHLPAHDQAHAATPVVALAPASPIALPKAPAAPAMPLATPAAVAVTQPAACPMVFSTFIDRLRADEFSSGLPDYLLAEPGSVPLMMPQQMADAAPAPLALPPSAAAPAVLTSAQVLAWLASCAQAVHACLPALPTHQAARPAATGPVPAVPGVTVQPILPAADADADADADALRALTYRHEPLMSSAAWLIIGAWRDEPAAPDAP